MSSLLFASSPTRIILAIFVALNSVQIEGRCNPQLDTIENGYSSAVNRTYGPGEVIKFTCDRGYRTTSRSWRVCVVRRGSNGSVLPVWEGITPRCEETQCSRPRAIENGKTKIFSTAVGGLTRFKCRSGFELIGDSLLICQENGQWNGTIPVCDNGENDCPPLAAPLNGYKIGDSYSRYQTVEFSCEPGYALSGSRERECMFNGEWSGEEARCIGSLDFDDINQVSAVLRQSLQQLEIDNVLENEAQPSVSGPSQRRKRFVPTQHEFGVDLYFLFDSSDSVGTGNFEKGKNFAIELVRKIGVTAKRNSLRVGAIYFSSLADIAFHTVDDFRSTEEVISHGIKPIPFTGGGRNIAEALRLVNDAMIPLGEHREGTYKAVFLISNGRANIGGSPGFEAMRLKRRGVKIHCLSISESADREELYKIGSLPHREHVFFLKNYDGLTQLIAKVTDQKIDYSECGIARNTISRGRVRRVVGGNRANQGGWPWQVLLDIRKGPRHFRCGGVLIDRTWVLTAAHCLPDDIGYTITVVLGVTDLSRPRHQQIEVEERILHPGWQRDGNPFNYQNDIALLKLRSPAVLNANVRTVCLPNKTRADKLIPPNPSNRHIGVMTGWGSNTARDVGSFNPGAAVDRLQQLALPLKSRDSCRQSLAGDEELQFFDETMFCAGYQNIRLGACTGDAGGPLVKKALRQSKRRWTVIGLTSWGRGCAVQNEFDFFTNVPYFMDWITETMNLFQQEEGEVADDSVSSQG